jgi:hypothetical protein
MRKNYMRNLIKSDLNPFLGLGQVILGLVKYAIKIRKIGDARSGFPEGGARPFAGIPSGSGTLFRAEKSGGK